MVFIENNTNNDKSFHRLSHFFILKISHNHNQLLSWFVTVNNLCIRINQMEWPFQSTTYQSIPQCFEWFFQHWIFWFIHRNEEILFLLCQILLGIKLIEFIKSLRNHWMETFRFLARKFERKLKFQFQNDKTPTYILSCISFKVQMAIIILENQKNKEKLLINKK